MVHMQQWAAGGRHGRNLQSVKPYQKSASVNRCIFIYLKNNPVKFHPDPIWNDGALGFLARDSIGLGLHAERAMYTLYAIARPSVHLSVTRVDQS